jgi:hypothetical protein
LGWIMGVDGIKKVGITRMGGSDGQIRPVKKNKKVIDF